MPSVTSPEHLFREFVKVVLVGTHPRGVPAYLFNEVLLSDDHLVRGVMLLAHRVSLGVFNRGKSLLGSH